MNILCIGDIVGKPGRQALQDLLEGVKKERQIDFIVANAENAAGGSGVSARIAKQLFRLGCDVITLGDHVWDQKEMETYLDEEEYLLRPSNFPEGVPGKGWCIRQSASGIKVGVINLLGRVFMKYSVRCPFLELDAIVKEIQKQTAIIIVDMHAETTSEKVAMGHFADGKVSAIVGTHTHIQTADEKVLPKGTAYITDLGMTGPYDSVIGQDKARIIRRYLTSMPVKFSVAKSAGTLHGAIIEVNEKTGRARKITRLRQV